MKNDVTIEQAAQALREAQAAYDDIHLAAEEARRLETAAKNELNSAQKAFDTAVEQIKKGAPRDSNWWSESYQPMGRQCDA